MGGGGLIRGWDNRVGSTVGGVSSPARGPSGLYDVQGWGLGVK